MSGKPIVLVGLKRIADEVGCSRDTLYQWIRIAGFPAFKMSGTWRALPGDVEAWFREQYRRQRCPSRWSAKGPPSVGGFCGCEGAEERGNYLDS